MGALRRVRTSLLISSYGPKPRLQRDLDRLADGIAALRIVHSLIQGQPRMPGEIRSAMATLRASRNAMTADLVKQISAIQDEVTATHADGTDALKLPRAELEQTKAEIAEIRAEFAQSTNGGPQGPLPGQQGVSPPSSANQSAEKKS